MKTYSNIFNKIISVENLFTAWDEFKKDKQKKRDVQRFELNLEEHLFTLHRELKSKTYRHGPYEGFYIHDPKRRHIHKASVRDRVLHHAIFSVLNAIFEPAFIAHSFSCRVNKGTHRGVAALGTMLRKISGNGTRPCFALKCDIKKFFQTIDHAVLLRVLKKWIRDHDACWLLEEVVGSFSSEYSTPFQRKGLPIGNLTSQLFANIYLNELDQFIKHVLKVKCYVRYTDDFVIAAEKKQYLQEILVAISAFLEKELLLTLHPTKVVIRKFSQGIDFLGYVLLPHYRLLRVKTKQRIFRKLKKRVEEYKTGNLGQQTLHQSLQSYLGVLSYANTYRLQNQLKNTYWFRLQET